MGDAISTYLIHTHITVHQCIIFLIRLLKIYIYVSRKSLKIMRQMKYRNTQQKEDVWGNRQYVVGWRTANGLTLLSQNNSQEGVNVHYITL